MKTTKVAIPLIISLILSAVGLSYAAWTDMIVFEGEAKMGTVTLAYDDFEPPICSEFHQVDGVGPLVPGEYLGKDVANCCARYEEPIIDSHTEKTGFKVLMLEINNSYPCLHVRTTFILHNIGTIPIMAYGFNITGEKVCSQTGALVYRLLKEPISAQAFYLVEDVNGNGIVDAGDIRVMECQMTNSWPVQIEPCNKDKREFDIHFLQPSQQCHIYYLHIKFDAIQWNKLYEVQ